MMDLLLWTALLACTVVMGSMMLLMRSTRDDDVLHQQVRQLDADIELLKSERAERISLP
jgi:hypothetical protein